VEFSEAEDENPEDNEFMMALSTGSFLSRHFLSCHP